MANKPITVLRKEFVDNLIKLINECGLPAFVISDALKLTLAEVNLLAERQYQNDVASMKVEEEKVIEE